MPSKKKSVSNVSESTTQILKNTKNVFAALLDNDSDKSDNENIINNNTKESTDSIDSTELKNENIVKLEYVINSNPIDNKLEKETTYETLETLETHETQEFDNKSLDNKSLDNNKDTKTNENSWTNITRNAKNGQFNNTSHFQSQSHFQIKFRSNGKYDDKILEYKQIYDENEEYGDIGNDKKLNSQWTMWLHQTDNNDWTLQGYQKRYVINSIGSFWRCFNNFQFYDLYKNQIFMMRDEIAPIWEDVNNKFGGICSIKIDSTQRGFKTDISTEIFVSICLLAMNETMVMSNDTTINGISYAVRKKNILIKLWTRTFYEDNKFVEELPKTLINKFNSELQKHLLGTQFENSYKMSIQYKKIQPQYEI